MTTITLLPPAPSRADPLNFADVADTFVAALPAFGTEANLVAGEINTNATTASTAATTATTQAGIATTGASTATTQAGIATTQAGIATTQASNASSSASTATTQAGIATTKAAEALASANAAAASAAVIDLTAPGPIGGTTPAAGSFTTLTSTGNATIGDAEASDTHTIKGATTVLANSASAALTVTQTGAGNAFVVEDLASPDSTPFVINASGFVGVGTNAPGAPLDVSGDGFVSPNFRAYGASAGTYPTLIRGRGTQYAPTLVQNGDALGGVQFSGYDGASNITGALIRVDVDGTPGTNDMPGRLVFSTTADGASSPTERMRIDSAGLVTLSNGLSVKGVTETVFTITDGASVDINPANGSIQTWTLGANRTATASSFAAGQSILIGIDDGTAYSLTWPTITWSKVGGSGTAPTLTTTGRTWIILWKVSSTLYGSLLGSA